MMRRRRWWWRRWGALGLAMVLHAVPAQAASEKKMRSTVAPYRQKLDRIAACESTSRWHLNSGNGHYGGLQFNPRSWRWVGGRGYAHQASKLEQKYRAVLLMRIQGWGAWPVCGAR